MELRRENGFTIVELLIVIVVIGILSALVLNSFKSFKEKAYFSRAKSEFKTMEKALEMYRIDEGQYPDDVNRDIPPGIEVYLEKKDLDRWPNGPWPGSVYDYDAFDNSGTPTYQISIRFCTIGQPDTCRFPKVDWAEDFEINSSVYFCLDGNCKAHPSEVDSYPGKCVNCN
jgi:general secretion pathway protein G